MSLIASVFLKLFTVKNVDTWMHRRSCLRTSFDSQLVHVSQTLHRYEKTNFYSTFPLALLRRCWKTSLLISLISGLYVKPLLPNGGYSHRNTAKYSNPFKCSYLQNQKLPSEMLFHFYNLHKISNIFKKLWASQLKYFWNYSLWKTWIIECIGGLVSEHPSAVNCWPVPNTARVRKNELLLDVSISLI